MTDTSTLTPVRIYTRELELERANQAVAAAGENRLAVLRNRIARAHAPKLVLMLVVASERGDSTIVKELRQALDLPAGTKVADLFEVKPSRRASYSKEAQRLAAALGQEIPTKPEPVEAPAEVEDADETEEDDESEDVTVDEANGVEIA